MLELEGSERCGKALEDHALRCAAWKILLAYKLKLLHSLGLRLERRNYGDIQFDRQSTGRSECVILLR